MSADWQLGLRAFPRGKIFQPANLAIGRDSTRVHMLDVSASGAKIHSIRPLDVGARVVLEWGDQKRSAEVAWSQDTKSGLRFTVPLSATDMAMLLKAS